MTERHGGRLCAALSCGVAACALLSGGALAQDGTTIDTATTTPLATATTGDLTVSGPDGAVTVTSGTAVTVDADADVTVTGTLRADSEAAGASALAVTQDVAGTITLGDDGLLSVTSEVTADQDEAPPAFPENRFGLLIAETATLTGDVDFVQGSSVAVDTNGGAGVAVLGGVIGDVSIASDVAVEGNGANGIRIGGTVGGDVAIASVAAAAGNNAAPDVSVRGVGSNAMLVDGAIEGRLLISRALVTAVRTDTVTDDGANPDNDPQLSDEEQAALTAGNALRITGQVGEGLVLTASRPATTVDDVTTPAQTPGVLASPGGVAALYVGEGATIGARPDDPATEVDESLGGFGIVNGGTIAAASGVAGTDARAILIEEATIARGLSNSGTISAEATGLEADAIGLELGVGANASVLVNSGQIIVSGVSDRGDAIGVVDRSGSITQVVNAGTVRATLTDFVDRNLPTDDTSDEDPPSGSAIAYDLSENTTGVGLLNTGTITGDVAFGAGDDLYDGVGNGTGRTALHAGGLDTGAGDDTVQLLAGARLGGTVSTGAIQSVTLGTGRDVLAVNGANTLLIADVDFGDDVSPDGGAFTVTDGAGFFGSLSGADAVDVTIGTEAEFQLSGGETSIGSLTTLEGPEAEMDEANDGAVLTFAVARDGLSIGSLDVAGDVTIADDTRFRTVFDAAFGAELQQAIITAGGSLDVDLSFDRLDTAQGVVPFLFSQSLSLSDDGQAVLLNLDRKSADELGIDPALSPAYEPIIAALVAANVDVMGPDGVVDPADPAVGRSIFNIPDQEQFLTAFEQFLPGPLDAPLTYARTQNDSVTSVVTQRVTQLREGLGAERKAWLQEQSYFVDRGTDGAARGFDGGGFVIALGVDTPAGPLDTIGLSASVASARYDEEAGEDFPFNRLTYSVGAYAAEDLGPLQLDGRVSYGWVSSESERNLVLGTVNEDGLADGENDIRRTTIGDWDGTEIAAYGRVLYKGRFGAWDVQPFASVDYLDLTEDAYTETGTSTRATALTVEEREAKSLRGNAGLIVGREFRTQPSRFDSAIPATIAPRLTLAYSEELDGDPLVGTYRFGDGENFILAQDKPGGAFTGGADVVYENEYARLGIGGSVTAGDSTQIYSLRIGVGLKW